MRRRRCDRNANIAAPAAMRGTSAHPRAAPLARTGQLRLIISREKRAAAIGDQNRRKTGFEKPTRRARFHIGQGRPIRLRHTQRGVSAREGRRGQERSARRFVIRIAPTCQIAESQAPQARGRGDATAHRKRRDGGGAQHAASAERLSAARMVIHSPVAISSQFGSGAPILRPKVQKSVSRRTSFGSPSTMRCSVSRTTVINSPTKRISISAI